MFFHLVLYHDRCQHDINNVTQGSVIELFFICIILLISYNKINRDIQTDHKFFSYEAFPLLSFFYEVTFHTEDHQIITLEVSIIGYYEPEKGTLVY